MAEAKNLRCGADGIPSEWRRGHPFFPWYRLEPSRRPEAGLLGIRKALNLFANVRPAYLYDELKAACPLRDEVIGKGF